MSKSPEIYFHVGLGKTGTTFLQYQVFTELKGIQYIQRTRYKKAKTIIAKGKSSKYLVSREFDQQFEKEIKDFASTYPNTTAIMVLRRHDSWIASQYRRAIKNGFTYTFNEFIDLKNDNGFFKIKDLTYYNMILLLEKHFTKKPIVLLYDDMKNDPKKFITYLCEQMDASINVEQLNLKPKHPSYNEKQLTAIFWLSKRVNIKKERVFKNEIAHIFHRLYLSVWRYGTLYLAKMLPISWFSQEILPTRENLLMVKKHFEVDWEFCVKYINN